MSKIQKIIINGEQYILSDGGAVVFDAAQSLTEDQMLQARENMAAAAQEDILDSAGVEEILRTSQTVTEIVRTHVSDYTYSKAETEDLIDAKLGVIENGTY